MVEKQSSLVCEQPHSEIQMDLLFVVTEPLFSSYIDLIVLCSGHRLAHKWQLPELSSKPFRFFCLAVLPL